jgi:hypothetical protein
MNQLDESLAKIKAAEDAARQADRQIMREAEKYKRPKIVQAKKRITELETYFHKVAEPFCRKIEANPSGKVGNVAEMLFGIRRQFNVPNYLRVLIKQAEEITFEELMRSGRNQWRAVLDCRLSGLNPGIVEDSIKSLMGQIEVFLERMASSDRINGMVQGQTLVPPAAKNPELAILSDLERD